MSDNIKKLVKATDASLVNIEPRPFQRALKILVIIIFLTYLLFCDKSLLVKAADIEYRNNMKVVVDGSEKADIMVLEHNYDRNVFVSLQGIAYCLRGSKKAFAVSQSDSDIVVMTSSDYNEEPGHFNADELREVSRIPMSRKVIKVDGGERRYYTISSSSEIFMTPLHMAMLLDLDIQVEEGKILIDTSKGFGVTKEEIIRSEYLEGINSLLVGNGTTGDVYFEHDADEEVPIASTTKLMTYFVMKDELAKGHVSESDMVTISPEANKLSNSIDGVIPMATGIQVPLKELVYGMLLASSNECSYSIAKHVAGDEKSFVDMMNQKAEELGLKGSHFHNCHGLPNYEYQMLPAKRQNHMTARDMFVLSSELLKTYPEILDITQLKTAKLEVLKTELKTTNAVLYNMDEVKGLKTGTTNKSGACLITCGEVEKNGEQQYLLSVLFGAEGEYDRATVSELMMRYAKSELEGFISETGTDEIKEIPKDPEQVVRMLLKIA